MHLKSRKIISLILLLGICHSVYLISPRALLKRSILRRRLLSFPQIAFNSTMRLKRQLFREDIPHHRPLTGNTYYHHAGFPHPSRWHEGPQLIHPNPNPITHHHIEHHRKPGLHDDLHNNHLNSHNQNHHEHQIHAHEPPPVSLVHNHVPHTVTIHSDIVHGGVGEIIGNSLLPSPGPSPHGLPPLDHPAPPHHPVRYRKKKPKPHPQQETFGEDGFGEEYGPPLKPHEPIHSPSPPPEYHVPAKTIPLPEHPPPQPSRKPKTIIHYHPVTVGNIINFNDDHKPVSYGPPEHVPGIPLAHPQPHHLPHPSPHPHPHSHSHHHSPSPSPHLLSMAEPFIKTPFKTHGEPDFLDFAKDVHYGPPNHTPGAPLGHFDLGPMVPSYGPPIKEDPPPYSVALPVLAHLHSSQHHHHHHHHPPPKRHRSRHHRRHPPPHRHHLHFHHIHHGPPPPGDLGGPFFEAQHPTYVVHGHVPNKFMSFHSPHFRRHAVSHHHHKSFWL